MYEISYGVIPCQSNVHLWEGIEAQVVFTHHANGRLYLCCRCASRKWSTMQKEGAHAYFIGDEHTEIKHKKQLKDEAWQSK